jgi:hypothetical protein
MSSILSSGVTRNEVWIGNWIYRTLNTLTKNDYHRLTELHAPKITVTTAHIKSYQSSLAVGWYRFPTADVPLSLGSRTVPMSQQPASHNYCYLLQYVQLVWAKITFIYAYFQMANTCTA